MKNFNWWVLAVLIVLLATVMANAQNLTPVQRTRIALDVIKDGDVTTLANYQGVDLAAPALTSKYVDAIVAYYGGPTNGTNDEKARFYLNQLRRWHFAHLKHQKEQPAVADATEEAQSEVDADLGEEETVMENDPPSAVTLSDKTTTLPDDTDTTERIQVATITVTDDEQGDNVLAVTGADAAMFEIDSGKLYLKAGSELDNGTNPSLDVTVTVDDAAVGATPDASDDLSISVTAA